MTVKTHDKQDAAGVDSARDEGTPSAARDDPGPTPTAAATLSRVSPLELSAVPAESSKGGPKTTAAQRAEAWHREKAAESAAAQQKREVELAERREADRERGERLKADVQNAVENHSERLSELRQAERGGERLRREKQYQPGDFHTRINEVVEAAETRIRDALARPVDATLPRAVPRLDPKLALDWLLATDARLAERWHEVSGKAMADSPTYSARPAKAIEKALDGARKEVEAARESEREAQASLNAARKSLYDWSAGR